MAQVKMKTPLLILFTLCTICCIMGDQDQEDRLEDVEDAYENLKLTVNAIFTTQKNQQKLLEKQELKIQEQDGKNQEQDRKIQEQDGKIQEQDGKIKHLQQAETELKALKKWLFWPNFEHVFTIDDKIYLYSGTKVSFDKAKQLCSQFRSKVFEPTTSKTYNEVTSRLSELAVPSEW